MNTEWLTFLHAYDHIAKQGALWSCEAKLEALRLLQVWMNDAALSK